MKKLITILVVMALVVAFTATSQIQRGKKPAQSKPKTEQPQGQNNSTSSKKKKTQKTDSSSKSSSRSGHQSSVRSNGMTQAEKDRIIQKTIDDMVYVEGGTFTMGATIEQGSDAELGEKPVHQVTLSGYYISKYEVTQALWQSVMGSNPSEFKGDLNRPVENVSWNDCQTFISKLNKLTGKRFRLPTEAEWEFAARGGNRCRGYKYSGSNDLSSVAWYLDNSGGKTHLVGTKSPNELGLYDMSGNVYEWCQDWKGEYSSASQTNPTGPSSGSHRICRGGSWGHYILRCRVSCRDYDTQSSMSYFLGLRLAL